MKLQAARYSHPGWLRTKNLHGLFENDTATRGSTFCQRSFYKYAPVLGNFHLKAHAVHNAILINGCCLMTLLPAATQSRKVTKQRDAKYSYVCCVLRILRYICSYNLDRNTLYVNHQLGRSTLHT